MSCILEIKNLKVDIFTDIGVVKAIRNIDLELNKEEILAIVGESGCGKTMLCRTIQGILPKSAKISGGEINLPLKEKGEKNINYISMIFQNPMSALNPTMKIGDQIREGILNRKKISRSKAKEEAIKFMELVGIENAKERYNFMPHEFSGGMRQRIVIAIALCTEPNILIADEPTTALDVTIQKQILNLILDLKEKMGLSVIFITHDLSIVANIADRVAVMYAGKIIEIGTTEEIFEDAKHPYTKALLRALPTDKSDVELISLEGAPPSLIKVPKGDFFARRNKNALKIDFHQEPPMFEISKTHKAATWTLHPLCDEILDITLEKELDEEVSVSSCEEKVCSENKILEVKGLKKYFPLNRKSFVKAVDDVSLEVYEGEVLGIVGESGSGKSTLGRTIMKIHDASEGSIKFENIELNDRREYKRNKDKITTDMQIIFQDSSSCLNQKKRILDIISEPIRIKKLYKDKKILLEKILKLIESVGLKEEDLYKYPTDMSGGQRQRVAIARSLMLDPKFIIADEPIASLDVSMQAQIINLFKHLVDEHNLSCIFIGHDLSMVKYISDRIAVMYKGKIVELAQADELYENPIHPYTKLLLSSKLSTNPKERNLDTVSPYNENDEIFNFEKSKLIEVKDKHFVYMIK